MDKIIHMKSPKHWQNHTNWTLAMDPSILDIYDEDDEDGDDAFILDAKYEATSGQEVADKQHHLTVDQRRQLAQALSDTAELFDGKLGRFKNGKIHLEVEPKSKPVFSKPYRVPMQNESAFIKELKHLQEQGVLQRLTELNDWASPTFIIPKTDGRV
jgi:hypothetical protein